jgi:O6-methylguanine-DNA--protein-cysteine methyltransferase
LLFSHRNRSKLVSYRLVRDGGCYCILNHNETFPSIPQLIDHYKTTPINAAFNTQLISPVLSEQQKSLPEQQKSLPEQQKSLPEQQKSLPHQQPDAIYGTVETCKSYSQITGVKTAIKSVGALLIGHNNISIVCGCVIANSVMLHLPSFPSPSFLHGEGKGLGTTPPPHHTYECYSASGSYPSRGLPPLGGWVHVGG